MRATTKEIASQVTVVAQQFKVVTLRLFHKMDQSGRSIQALMVPLNTAILVDVMKRQPSVIGYTTAHALPAIPLNKFNTSGLAFLAGPSHFVSNLFFIRFRRASWLNALRAAPGNATRALQFQPGRARFWRFVRSLHLLLFAFLGRQSNGFQPLQLALVCNDFFWRHIAQVFTFHGVLVLNNDELIISQVGYDFNMDAALNAWCDEECNRVGREARQNTLRVAVGESAV